jgi:hypothetical protein
MTLVEQALSVRTREEFVGFLVAVSNDLKAHPGHWTNNDLAAFLEAMAAWGEDMAGYYANRGEDVSNVSPWRIMTDLIVAARTYE